MTREQYPHPFVLERAFAAMLQLRMGDVDMDRAYQSCNVRVRGPLADVFSSFGGL